MPDWINSWDWGTVSSWVTAGVALTAVLIARNNLKTARASYADDAWQRKVSQARQVWGEVQGSTTRRKGDALRPHPTRELGLENKWPGLVNERLGDVKETTVNDKTIKVLGTDVTYFVICVRNNSDAPIGEISLGIRADMSDEMMDRGAPEVWRDWTGMEDSIPVLSPGDWFIRVFLAGDMFDVPSLSYSQPMITFTDAAGVKWTRCGTSAPELHVFRRDRRWWR